MLVATPRKKLALLKSSVFYKHFTSIVKIFLQFDPKSRYFKGYDDDTFIVPYPKSGNTWMRFVLMNLIPTINNANGFSSMHNGIPDIYQTSMWSLAKHSRPRIMKSHECFHPRYNRIIYIVRDPREIAVSAYYYCTSLQKLYSISEFTEDWVAGKYFSLFGTWQEHVNSWLYTRQSSPDFLLLRYEDMLDNPSVSLRRVAAFFDLDVSDDDIEKVVWDSSFTKMQNLEKQEMEKMTGRKTDMGNLFVRNGASQSWKQELAPGDIELIEKSWGDTMSLVGYEMSLPVSQDD